MSTPTPPPWIAEGYDLRQKHGRMIAYFGPHHTPADEYPMSCRLQDEANCQWVAALPAALAAAQAECERLKFVAEGHLLKTIQQQAELAAERERVRVLREALENLCDEQNGAPLCTREAEWKEAMDKADATLAATKEGK